MNRQLLEEPFDKKLIRQRKGNFGATLDYIEAHVVIQRLNDALDGEWSFEIVEYTQLEDEVVVLGRLSACGIVKQQFGSSKVTRAKGSDDSLCIGDDLKSAASDALKKTATLLGVGLHLYGELGVDDTVEDDKSKDDTSKDDISTISSNHGDDRISKKQMATIKKLRTDLGWSADEVMEKSELLFATREIAELNSTMGAALIAYLQNQGNGSR